MRPLSGKFVNRSTAANNHRPLYCRVGPIFRYVLGKQVLSASVVRCRNVDQTIMLLAVECCLDTCAQEVWSMWSDTVRQFCGLDDEALVFAGMAMGYCDEKHPINRLRADRAGVDEFVTFHGF